MNWGSSTYRMVLFCFVVSCVIQAVSLALPFYRLPFLSGSLVFMLLYLWSREFPTAKISLMGVLTLQVRTISFIHLSPWDLWNDDIYNWRMSFLSGIVCISASVSGCHTPSSTSLIMFWNADYHRGCSVHLYFQWIVLNTCSWIVPICSSTWVSCALTQCRNAMWHNLRKKYLYSVGTESPPRYSIALIATSILITCILFNYTTHEPCEDVAIAGVMDAIRSISHKRDDGREHFEWCSWNCRRPCLLLPHHLASSSYWTPLSANSCVGVSFLSWQFLFWN